MPGLIKERRRWVAWTGLAALAALAVLIAASPTFRAVLLGLWVLANFGAFCVLVGYGVFHLRSVTPALGLSAAWSLGLGAVLAVGAFSYVETFVGEYFGFKVPAGMVFIGVLASFIVLSPTLLFGGFAGAAAGAWLGPGEDRAPRARTGAVTWYLIATTLLLGTLRLPTDAIEPQAALLLGGPVLTLTTVSVLRRRGLEPGQIAALVLRLLSSRLIWRFERRGRKRRLDFRGAALGLLAGGLALLVGASEVLVPVQSLVLVSLIRARNEPMLGERTFVQMASREARRQRRGIVLLRFDPATRRSLATRSEIEIQLAAIRKLRRWGARTIVLPAPVLDLDRLDPFATEGPVPQLSDAQRNRRDLPKLENLLRRAPNVVLGLPERQEAFVRKDFDFHEEERSRSDELLRLARAARHTGQSGVAFFGAARLPAIPTTWEGEPPLALIAAAAIRRAKPLLARDSGGKVRFLDREFQEVAPGKVLIDFLASRPEAEFPSVTYGELHRGEPVYDTSDLRAPTWVEPRKYFADKIVFLDTLSPLRRDTPIGTMPLQEVVAGATATLLAGSALHAVGPATFWAWTLFLSWWTGVVCARRNPVTAGWRALALVALVFGVTFWAFMARESWIDPIVPSSAVLGSFLLATQLTFELERGERDRQRTILQRFAGPELVEQMLDDPDFVGRLGGQRRQVCVVFADVRNFTRFAERSTPEEVIDITNRYLGAMTDVVMAQGGILDKYTGDGLMAFFQETPGEHQASQAMNARAVSAAIGMQQAAARISAELAAEGREPLRVGIGLHYGEAVVGLVGNPNRWDYTALGHTVVVSQRLQSIAEGGEVVISETVYRTVYGLFPVEEGEPVQVKGLSEPVRPYRVASFPVPYPQPVPGRPGSA